VNSHVHATVATALFDHVSGDIPSGAKRKLVVTPVTGVPGTAKISVTVSDGSLSSSTSFDFSTNTAPFISKVADTGLEQGTTSPAIPVAVGDDETGPESVTLTATSNKQNIIANADITIGGSGTDRTITLRAKPGVKDLVEITVSATDGQLTATRKFRVFVAPAGTIKVVVNGFGAVSDFFGEGIQTPGKQLTISAKPVNGQAFNGWAGIINSYDPKITFTMPAVMYLEATFTESPYPRQSGIWNGLVLNDPRTHDRTGAILVTVNKNGAYSGKLIYAGKPWSFRGILHTDGSAADAAVLRKGLSTLNVHFAWDGIKHLLNGTVTDGADSSAFVAHHALFTTSSRPQGAQRPLKAGWLGKVTALFEADPTAGPIGSGFATGSVNGSGAVKLVGKLADGTSFSSGAFLSIDGDLPFQTTLYKGLGSAAGWLVWRNLPTTDFTGSVTTFRPANEDDPTFSTGWPDGATLSVAGSYYVAPKGATTSASAILPLPDLAEDTVTGNAVLALDGAGYIAALREVHISPLGKITLSGIPTGESLSLSLKASSGLLSGKADVNEKAVTLGGAVLQKANRGGGFSLTTGLAGDFALELAE
jgi:hypothetical protein